ncbi:porin family protein, partial [Mesorhizobium sp. M7A.F.Ca.US.007.01.2.1]
MGQHTTMKILLLATAIILAPAGMACAADIAETSPTSAYDWSG